MRTLCKLAFVIAALPMLMAADVYRWVDAEGVVNYTQRKPEGVDAARLQAATGQPLDAAGTRYPTDPTEAVPAGVDPSPAAGEGPQSLLARLQAAELARQAEVARVRESNCEQSRAVLSRLSDKGRIRVRGDEGEHRVMPEEERQERIAQAQRDVVDNCSPQSL
jgi:hypothetical protein